MPMDYYNVIFLPIMGEGSTAPVLVQNARLYPRSLNATEIRELAQDPDVRPCIMMPLSPAAQPLMCAFLASHV
jgi:hypothetical protein